MFLRPHYRKRDGRREAYWVLVESYRTERGPRQRTVAYLARIRVEYCRAFGDPWTALELIRRLGVDEFLKRTLPRGREAVPWSLTAPILIIARLSDCPPHQHPCALWR
jgi:hypothetical protein